MKKVTLKDIALKVGVTVGTVSHVMNGIDDISEETRDKVLKAADELGYISNSSAVSLRSGKTNTIAIIVPDVSNPHIARQVKLIEQKLKDLKYTAIILNTDEDDELEKMAIVTSCSRRVDGILLCPSQHSRENIKFLKAMDVPYVLIGRYFAEGDSDYVTADDCRGGRLAGEYLLNKGYKKPVYIGAYKYIEPSVLRFDGLCKAFAEKGIELLDNRFFETSPTGEKTHEVFEKIKKSGIEFDSVVAFSDFISFELMSLVNVPVIGFDAINTYLNMPLKHVSVGMTGNGWADMALHALFGKINGSSERFCSLVDVAVYEFGDEK